MIAETPLVFSVDLIKKHRLSSEAGSGDALIFSLMYPQSKVKILN
jgi:hypothetical protein